MKATVRRITGKTKHWIGTVQDGPPQPVEELTDRVRTVRIEATEGTFYLLRLDADGGVVADTWHESLEAAKRQAELEYGILDEDWSD